MKKLFTLFISFLICIAMLRAQSPQKMSYQAVVRDAAGKLVVNQGVGIRISILQGSATGTEVFKEIYNPNYQTNTNGLVTLEIGSGLSLTGTFAGINWANGPYFLKTETDPTGGTNYTVVGTSQLLSVPFALYAKTAESINGGITETDPVFSLSVAKGIKSIDTAKWNAKSSFSGKYKDLTNKPTFTDSIGKYSVLLTGNQTIAGNKTFGSDVTINGITFGMGNSNYTNSFNTAIGYQALYFNTSGIYNTANGYKTLYYNTSGSTNSAYGYQALNSNTTGNANTAIGSRALLYSTTGSFNTANGSNALADNTTGNENTAFGESVLVNNTTGSDNTAIGFSAGPPYGYKDLINITALGSYAAVTSSNSIMLGNSSVTSIGGYAAWSNFSDGRFKTNVQTNVPGLSFILKLRPVTFTWDLHKLDAYRGVNEGSMLKSTELEKARLAREKKIYTGFIAQEVEQAAANCGFDFSGIVKPENDKTPYNLSYAEFVVPLVKAMQEQQKLIEALNKQNTEIMSENMKIKSELLALKAAVDDLLKK